MIKCMSKSSTSPSATWIYYETTAGLRIAKAFLRMAGS
jgi:hypothetical protein